MSNIVQFYSFLFSFLFGMFFAFCYELNMKFIKEKAKKFRVIIVFLFVTDMTLLYLVALYHINGGIVHIYFLGCIALGYSLSIAKIKMLIYTVKNKIKLLKKKWQCYNICENRWNVMVKNRGSKKAKRRMFFLFSVLIVVLAILVISLFSDWKQIYQNKIETKTLLKKYQQLMDEEITLESEVIKFQDPDYVARYAREKYLYSLPDELIIRIPKK